MLSKWRIQKGPTSLFQVHWQLLPSTTAIISRLRVLAATPHVSSPNQSQHQLKAIPTCSAVSANVVLRISNRTEPLATLTIFGSIQSFYFINSSWFAVWNDIKQICLNQKPSTTMAPPSRPTLSRVSTLLTRQYSH